MHARLFACMRIKCSPEESWGNPLWYVVVEWVAEWVMSVDEISTALPLPTVAGELKSTYSVIERHGMAEKETRA
jgi:hypothetical protein